jgi:hypothetical protein
MICLGCLDKPVHLHEPNNQGVVLVDASLLLGQTIYGDSAPGVVELTEMLYVLGPVHVIGTSAFPFSEWKKTVRFLGEQRIKVDALILPKESDDPSSFKALYVEELKERGVSVRFALDGDPAAYESYQELGVPCSLIRRAPILQPVGVAG